MSDHAQNRRNDPIAGSASKGWSAHAVLQVPRGDAFQLRLMTVFG